MKKTLALVLALCMAFMLAACSDSNNNANTPQNSTGPETSADKSNGGGESNFDPSNMVIGYTQGSTSTEWEIAQASATREPLEEAGYTVLYSDGQGQQENQIAAIRSYIAQDVDAIIIYPVTTTGWDAVLEEIKEANIPLIVFSRNIEPTVGKLTDYAICYVGPDNVYAGEIITQACLDYFADRDDTVNIVVLEGVIGASAAIERTEGINNVINAQDKGKIIASQSANFTRTDGKEVMEAIIKAAETAGNRIDAVIGENDDMSVGAIQALTEAGYNCGTDVWIGGVDGVYSAFESMVAGTYNCTVENPLNYGVEIERIFREYFSKGTMPEEWVVLKNDIYFMEEAADLIDTRTY